MDIILSVAVLVTVFIGLVTILLLYNSYKKRSLMLTALYSDQFKDWLLVTKGYRYPSISDMIYEINKQAKCVRPIQGGEQWTCLHIERLLPDTQLPSFEITSLSTLQKDLIVADLLIEWPHCIPGIEISVRDERGDTVICHLQVDWIIMRGKLTLRTVKEGGVRLSWQQTTPSTSAMSCLVMSPDQWRANIDIMKPITEEERETEHSENMSSSVTEGFIQLMNGLTFTDVYLPLHEQEREYNEREEPKEGEEPNEGEEKLISVGLIKDKSDEVSIEKDIEEQVIHHPLAIDETPPTEIMTTPTIITPIDDPLTTSPKEQTETEGNNGIVKPHPQLTIINESINESTIETPPSISETLPINKEVTLPTNNDEVTPPTGDNEMNLPTGDSPLSDHTSSWRRSTSYENLNTTNIMPHPPTPPTHQPRPQNSPLLISRASPPWASRSLTTPTYSPTSPQSRPSPPSYLSVTQSDDDLLNERSKRRTLTLSVRSYDTDTPVTTGRLPSTLVFEIEEGSHKRHIVAVNSVHAGKLKKQLSSYTKLHIYNDHTFIATHIKGKQLCGVCSDKVIGLFGKQCYICRDCSFLVHKECHFKVEVPCPRSKVPQMCLIYPDSISSVSQF